MYFKIIVTKTCIEDLHARSIHKKSIFGTLYNLGMLLAITKS